MKRLLAVLAALTLLLTGCAGEQESASVPQTAATGTTQAQAGTGEFLVGYGKTDITPMESVPLAGYGNTSNRMSLDATEPIYATCAAITDPDGNTVLLFGLDLTNAYTDPITKVRKKVSEYTGVPLENIIVSASHMHSGPDLGNTKDCITRYISLLGDWLTYCALDALDDRAPAQLAVNTVQTQGLNFVRRYVLENGTYAGDNYGDFDSSPIASHESEADAALQLVKFLRDGDKKDILMANFQTHPHRAGGSTNPLITPDLVGIFRDTVEQALGCHAMYFTGASGNVNPTSRIAEENITSTYKEQGRALAQYAIDAESSYTPVSTGRVQVMQTTFTGQVNHSQDDLLPQAQEIAEVWRTTGDKDKCKEMGAPYGINSPYHANSIVAKSKLGDTLSFDIWAVSIGDVAFAVAPYEMFDTNGRQIKEGSPFVMTFVLTCANSSNSYIPSALGFEHGGYSTDQCRFVPGTGELLVAEYLTNLNTLFETK